MRGSLFRFGPIAGLLAGILLSGCVKYRPSPLPTVSDLSTGPDVTAPAQRFDVPGLAPHHVSSDGFDDTAIMALAVWNNPVLKAQRLQAGLADAQLLEAGLLPDPQFSAGFATSALNYGGALGLSEDVQALITRGAAKAAARSAQKQIDLDILWKEIQVAEKARELFFQERADLNLQKLLRANQDLLTEQYRRDRDAMEAYNLTSEPVTADLTLVSDADTAIRQVEIDQNATLHQLNDLLGLQPEVHLPLVAPTEAHGLTRAQLVQAIKLLPQKRIDLVALQAGYESQEQNLRRAVLAQFPSLSAGVDLERDPVEGVNAFGPQVTLTLPLFNRNRGQIAIASATRESLRAQYQASLDAAAGQADQVWKACQILAAHVHDVERQLPLLKNASEKAEQSYRAGNLDAGLFVTTRSNYIAKQAEAVRLELSLEDAESSLSTILGLGFGTP